MKPTSIGLYLVLAGAAAFAAPSAGPQLVLISCPPEGVCEFRSVTSVTIDGKTKLQLFALDPKSISGPLSVKVSRQVRIGEMTGTVIRNSSTGIVSAFASEGRTTQVVVTPIGNAPTVDAAAAWTTARIDYLEPMNPKPAVLFANTFAGFLFEPDSKTAAVALARALVSDTQFPRRNDLIRGAARFASTSPQFVSLRASESDAMKAALKSFQDGSVEPDRLLATLKQGLEAADILGQISELNADEIKTRDELSQSSMALQRKASIAAALAEGGFWDEFAKKLNDMGLARWSHPDLIAKEPEALRQAAKNHLDKAHKLENQQPAVPDRVLDEAMIAFQRSPCDPQIEEYLSQARRSYLDKENSSEVAVFPPDIRRKLDGLVTDLGALERDHPETALEKIKTAIPESEKSALVQLLRVRSLRNLQRFAEARDVLADIARNIPLEPNQKKEWMQLDTDLSASLKEVLARSTSMVSSQMNQKTPEGYDKALQLSTTVLTMDPQAFPFLEQQVRAYSMLNRTAEASSQLNWWMKTGNASCADTSVLSQLADLTARRSLPPPPRPGQLRHWISGEPYAEGGIYYDSVSLGFAPRVKVIVSQGKGEETVFEWREFQLAAVATGSGGTDVTSQSSFGASFRAIPSYRSGTVYMSGISLGGAAEAKQQPYKLAYINDVAVNVAKGAVPARGWAANPFFHPFYWKKLLLFDFTYDDLGRVVKAVPAKADDNQSLDAFSQTLSFNWDGKSNRLLSIVGDRGYKRIMVYDNKNRLSVEKITDLASKGEGSIHYEYKGDRLTPSSATCESSFYVKGKKIIEFLPVQ